MELSRHNLICDICTTNKATHRYQSSNDYIIYGHIGPNDNLHNGDTSIFTCMDCLARAHNVAHLWKHVFNEAVSFREFVKITKGDDE